MKPITCFVAISVVVLVACGGEENTNLTVRTPARGQADCAATLDEATMAAWSVSIRAAAGTWNTHEFFDYAKVSDVTRCLQAGANPNARNKSGFTPLHWAASTGWYRHGSAETVTALLKAGANPNARNGGGATPLHFAAGAAHTEAVEALLQAGADLEARTKGGGTPLHSAASRSVNAVAFTLLLKASRAKKSGSPLYIDNAEVVTALHAAAQAGNDDTAVTTLLGEKSAEAIEALLKAGANPNARTDDGKLPFDYIKDNAQLKGTEFYWKLNQSRFE